MIDRYELVVVEVLLLFCFSKIIFGLEVTFCAERECAPMNAYRLPAPQLFVNDAGFFRVDVLRTQQMPRLIRSDRKNSEVERTKHVTNLFEHIAVASISRIEDLLVEGGFNDKTSPKPSVQIVHSPLRPVYNRHKRNVIGPAVDYDINLLHPIHQSQVSLLRHDV